MVQGCKVRERSPTKKQGNSTMPTTAATTTTSATSAMSAFSGALFRRSRSRRFGSIVAKVGMVVLVVAFLGNSNNNTNSNKSNNNNSFGDFETSSHQHSSFTKKAFGTNQSIPAYNDSGIRSNATATTTATSTPSATPLVWPDLRERLCPDRVPDVSLGPTLFRLARIEFGLAANASASRHGHRGGGEPDDNNNNKDENETDAILQNNVETNRIKTSRFFYHGGFGFTLYIDGADPKNNVLYASVWKSANNQIHDYLSRVYNRKPDGGVKNISDKTTGHPNDFYLERLGTSDLRVLFHEADHEQQQDIDTYGDDTDDDDHYFNFNGTSRTKPCVFTVLRDPISHFLAGYNECEYRLITGTDDAPEETVFDELASYTRVPYDDERGREKRFETFVRNLLKEHPSFSKFQFYKHFAAMSRILPVLSRFDLVPDDVDVDVDDDGVDDASRKQTWYLPTLSNLTERFPVFFAQTCPRMASNYYQQHHPSSQKTTAGSAGSEQDGNDDGDDDGDDDTTAASPQERQRLHPFPAMKPTRGHESAKDPFGFYQTVKDIWKKGGRVARALCVLHSMDYACFPERIEIPPFCVDVYAGESFAKAILSEQQPAPRRS